MKNSTGTTSLTAKLAALLLILCLLPCAALGDGEAPRAELTDNLVETKHSIEIGGKQIDYTATTGTIALESDLGQYEVFFTAYTVDSASCRTTCPSPTIPPVICSTCMSRPWSNSGRMPKPGMETETEDRRKKA